jgi:parallel beta-helix repeat protein
MEPAAFFSYVRADDVDGKLSEFRARLSGEVRVQLGREFPIFQDREDIGWGQQWSERIESALDAVTLLIPVLSPGFFASAACRAEVERFLDRERRLGRGDLVLPVYYVSTPHLDDPAVRATDPLAQVLAGRQFADWRELRFEPLTSAVAGRALAALAGRLRDPFWSPAPAPTRPAPVAKVEPPTLVVDPWGRGDHTTIGAAIDAAAPGSRILVRPGLYQEALRVEKPLEIIGDGPVGEVEVHARAADALVFAANIGRVSNLTLRQLSPTGEGVTIVQGRLELTDCDISSAALACVTVRNGADPRIRGNRIHDGLLGVVVDDDSLGTLEDNDISGHRHSGVLIQRVSRPTLRRNRIHDNSFGVSFSGRSTGVLEDNDITRNTREAVDIGDASSPVVRGNRIEANGGDGVHVHGDDSTGTIEDNDIRGNGGAGVAVRAGGRPTVRRNRIGAGNSGGGVYVGASGGGVISGNDVATGDVHVDANAADDLVLG